MHPRLRKSHGFTLIEILIAMMLVALLAGVFGPFITLSFRMYTDMRERAGLVDTADQSLRRIGRDVHRALPNSVRIATDINGNTALELLRIVDAGRYRKVGGTNPNGSNHAGDELVFTAADSAFNLIGTFDNLDFIENELLDGFRVAVYPTDTNALYTDAAAASGSVGVITPLDITPSVSTDADEHEVTLRNFIGLPQAFQFDAGSPAYRVYLVDTAVTYYCDAVSRQLTRHSTYTPTEVQAMPPTSGTSSILAQEVSDCLLALEPSADDARQALLSFSLTIGHTVTNQSVSLLHQFRVDNLP